MYARYKQSVTDTEAYYAHLSACVICIYKQEHSGSGTCIEGFRRFLRFSGEFWRKLKELQSK